MQGYPVIVRLIDPPMHEFLNPREEPIREVPRLTCTSENPEELGVGLCSKNVSDSSIVEFCQIARLNSSSAAPSG